jgi:DNA replication ATP-dependent helicase Dna2
VLSLSTQELSLTREGMALKEANLVKDIFTVYDLVTTYTTRQETMKNIIIVTPHHIQRRAISSALHQLSVQQNRPELRDILVDTVEKVQGKTADLVIICYGILTTEELATDCDFLFTPSRLNVSLSRARAKVVFIVGQCLHTVPAKFIRSRETQRGYNLFMQATQQAQEEGGRLDVVV